MLLEKKKKISEIDRSALHTVAFDLDGTLLGERGILSAFTRESIAALVKKDIHIVLATGRRFFSANEIAKEFGKKVAVVCNNGQILRLSPSEEKIYSKYLNSAMVESCFHLAKQHGIDPIFHVDYYEEGYDLLTEFPITDSRYYHYSRGDLARTFTPDQFNPNSIDNVNVMLFLHHEVDRLEALEVQLSQLEVLRGYRLVKTHIPGIGFCLEILDANVSKWSGIQRYLELENLHASGVVCFGDEHNDLEMIQHSGIGIAMQNAVPAVLEVADFITEKTNLEDGVAHSLFYLGIL